MARDSPPFSDRLYPRWGRVFTSPHRHIRRLTYWDHLKVITTHYYLPVPSEIPTILARTVRSKSVHDSNSQDRWTITDGTGKVQGRNRDEREEGKKKTRKKKREQRRGEKSGFLSQREVWKEVSDPGDPIPLLTRRYPVFFVQSRL